LPMSKYLSTFVKFMNGTGWYGYLIILGVYIFVSVVGIPRWLASVCAGFLYGMYGLILDFAGLVLGTCVIYFITNCIFSDRYRKALITNFPRFKGLLRATTQHEWKTLFVFNVSPAFPYTLVTYILSMTDIAFWKILFVATLTNFPYGVSYVILGASASHWGDLFSGQTSSWWRMLLLALGWIVTIAFTLWLGRLSKRMAAEIESEEAAREEVQNEEEIELQQKV